MFIIIKIKTEIISVIKLQNYVSIWKQNNCEL